MAVGQVLFVSGAGYFTVDAVPDATSVTLLNLGYITNPAPGTIIPDPQTVSPGGWKGTDGAAGATPTLNDISPTTTRGDVIVDNGANAPLASDVRLSAGADGTLFASDSAQPTGRKQVALTPNAATDNVLPRFDASGDTTPTPLQSSLLRITDTGALQETGGNAKGTDAVDLQPSRTANTQVASGNNATIAGGKNNTASGAESFAVGATNVASAAGATAIGGSNTASGAGATALGSNNVVSGPQAAALGDSNTVSGTGAAALGTQHLADADGAVAIGFSCPVHAANSTAIGNFCTTESGADNSIATGFASKGWLYGQRAHASGQFASLGDAQLSDLLWRGLTTDATANVEIFLDGAADRATVPPDTTWSFSILVTGRKDDGTSACWKVEGGIKNDGGVVVLVAAVTTTVIADGTGGTWGLAANVLVDADNGNDSLRVRVTGAAASNIRWVASARIVECSF